MKVKEFITKLQTFNPEAEILLSCDEELNTIFSDVQADYLEEGEYQVVMWGNSGSEIGEEYNELD